MDKSLRYLNEGYPKERRGLTFFNISFYFSPMKDAMEKEADKKTSTFSESTSLPNMNKFLS